MKYNSEVYAFNLLKAINQKLDGKRLVLNKKSLSYELLVYYEATEIYHYYKTFDALVIVIYLLEFIGCLVGAECE